MFVVSNHWGLISEDSCTVPVNWSVVNTWTSKIYGSPIKSKFNSPVFSKILLYKPHFSLLHLVEFLVSWLFHQIFSIILHQNLSSSCLEAHSVPISLEPVLMSSSLSIYLFMLFSVSVRILYFHFRFKSIKINVQYNYEDRCLYIYIYKDILGFFCSLSFILCTGRWQFIWLK